MTSRHSVLAAHQLPSVDHWCYLDDVTDDMAPMGVIPGSHDGPLYDLYDESTQ